MSCEYCCGKTVLFQETTNTSIYINTYGGARTIETECDPCPPHANCCMQGIPARSAFIINFCPNCGTPLTEPKPLTVEELRGMDGKSVRVKNLQHGTFSKLYVDCSCPYQWMRTKEGLLSILHTDDYGKTWVAYDRKPTDERSNSK